MATVIDVARVLAKLVLSLMFILICLQQTLGQLNLLKFVYDLQIFLTINSFS